MNKKHIFSVSVLLVIIIVIASAFLFKNSFISTLAEETILRAGIPLQFGSYTVQIDKVEGNKLYGIKVTSKNKKFTAKSGDYLFMPEKHAIKLHLIDGSADDFDSQNPGQYHAMEFKQSYLMIRLKSQAPKI